MFIIQYLLQNSMEVLIAKMRSLTIGDLKSRREKIFQKTRNFQEQECHNTSSNQTETLICNEDNEIEFQKEQYSVFNVQPNAKEEVQKQKIGEYQILNYKTRRYWRNFFRVNQRLVNIPNNLKDYYVTSYPKGTKCLLIFKRQEIELLDQDGYIIYSNKNPVAYLAGTILQVAYQKQSKTLVIVDLISWKTLSYGSLQFEYRITWLKDHTKYSLTALSQGLQMNVQLVDYRVCTFKNLQIVYNEQPLYARDGLFFVQSLSPKCLIWKDENTSKTFSQEYDQNKLISKGLGYLNKNGDVKTRENRLLFQLNPIMMRQQIRFVKFTYKGIRKITNQEGGKQVEFASLKLVGHESSNYEGFADTLCDLVYRCSFESNLIKIEDLLISLK